jgi:predicted DNA-binding transcriptional regulator YafY
MLANSLFNVFNGTPLKEKFSVVVNKVLAESLTGGPVIGLSEMNHLQLDSSKNNKSNQWIPTLLSSIHDQQAYEIQYKGFGKEEKKKIICPYVLKQFRNRWYVVAYDYTCERPFKTNLFALDGIQKMEISNKKYYTDPSFSPEDYFRYSLGVWHWHDQEPIVAELEFSSQIELVLLNPLHHSQKATLNDNGKMLSVSIEVYNSPELLMIIQSYGSSVKVISPPELIDAVIGSAKKVIELY